MTSATLVIAPSWIGDMVMAQPLLSRLKKSATSVSVLALPWIAPLLQRMAEVDEIIPMPVGHGKLALGERYRLGRSLKGKYQKTFVLPNTLKSALIPWFARIPERTGYKGEMRYGLLNDLRSLDEQSHPLLVQRYLALAGSVVTDEAIYPSLIVQPSQLEQTLNDLSFTTSDKPVIGLCPGAEYGPAKRWPVEYYAELASNLIATGNSVWLFGSANDQAVTGQIQDATNNRCLDLAGKTRLDQAIDLMSLTTAVVTNDSGLMHIAAALGRPVVALFGSTSPTYTPPLSEKAHVLQHDLECSPCFKRVCPLGHLNCLTGITVDEVMQQLQAQMKVS